MATVKEIYAHNLNLTVNKEQKSRNYNFAHKETTVYKSGKKTLVFVGGDHIVRDAPFIKFLRKAFDKTQPDFLLLERPKYGIEHSAELLNKPKDRWSEVQWAIKFAKSKGVPFAGMDADESTLFKPFIEMEDRDGIKAGILTWVLNYYNNPWRHKIRELSKEDLYDLAVNDIVEDFALTSGRFARFRKEFFNLHKRYKNASLHSFVKKVVQEATDKYVERKPFLSIAQRPRGWWAPYPFGKEYSFNKVRAWWDAYRNKSMIDESIEAMRKHDTVFALAGWGHIFVIRDLLEKEIRKEFSLVKVMRWNEFVK